MNESVSLLTAILFPVFMGIILLFLKETEKRKNLLIYVGAVLGLTGLLVVKALTVGDTEILLFELMENVPVVLKLDGFGKFFLVIVTIVWILAGCFSFTYMKHEKKENRYFGFYLITFGVLIGLGCAGNLITMYAFYEFMTLASFPLVIHNQSREAIMAGLKYLLYSFFGAYMALFGVFFLCRYTDTLTFTPGGTLNMELAAGHESLLLVTACLMIVGFGVKAGMFPLHAWLPTAHPVAPAPASAALSGIIVKAGVLAIVRTIFYMFGADFIRGTWVQYLFMTLALITVFMGSMLAFREKVLKKRLAYSTVSQLSYILFGIALLNPVGLTGSMIHMAAHAFIKCALFLCAGAIIFQTGITTVDGLKGIGKKMPVTIWCFTIVSLGLIGIPPTGGFISKWYLATGALDSGIGGFQYAGPIILLVSALLTAGYLLPVTIQGFFPGADFDYTNLKKCEPSKWMTIPLVILAVLSVVIGMFPNGPVEYISTIVAGLM
ncbi:MAG: proton-conducting membrane transporter [Lachnospiraceae bacterium]|nr:proton-conducting membrane transporter [Lachnospiraceae bacterium]